MRCRIIGCQWSLVRSLQEMQTFPDRLVAAIRQRGNPCVIGLDPRIELMPAFLKSGRPDTRETARSIIADFHDLVLDTVGSLIPAVKPQLAFFEQYGIPGMQAFEETLAASKKRGLLVIADAKRNDVSSTAEAYAKAYLSDQAFDADAMTVTPYLGRDSLTPYVAECAKHGKGLLVVLKTSNPGSRDFQDLPLRSTGQPLYESIAAMIDDLGKDLVGESGYSSIGAVVGATFPDDARRLRSLMPRAFILATGYGAQGASVEGTSACFNSDGLGAIVPSSRGITYAHRDQNITKQAFVQLVRDNTLRMIDEITRGIPVSALSAR